MGLLLEFFNQIKRVEISDSYNFPIDGMLGFLFDSTTQQEIREWNLPLLEDVVLWACEFDPERLASGVVNRASYRKAEGQAQRPPSAMFSLTLTFCPMTKVAFASMSESMVEGGLVWDRRNGPFGGSCQILSDDEKDGDNNIKEDGDEEIEKDDDEDEDEEEDDNEEEDYNEEEEEDHDEDHSEVEGEEEEED